MDKRGHFILGIIFAFIVVMLMGWLNLNIITLDFVSVAFIIGITLFYSILPDVDHKSGTMTWWFLGVATVGVLFGVLELMLKFGNPLAVLLCSALLLVFTFVATNFFEHRGIIHSIPVGMLSVVPIWFLLHNFAYCIFAYVAWHSHLVGDGYIFKIR